MRQRLLLALVWACLLAGPAAAQDSPVLRKIRDAGVITLGYRIESVPFSYLDQNRRPIGYTMDICQRVVDAVRRRLAMPDLEVRLLPVSSATRLPLVANGTVDLECGTTTNTADRAKQVAFSITTFVAASRLVFKKDAPIHSIDDLRGQPVATTLATTSIEYLHRVNESHHLNMQILAGLDDVESFRLVGQGRAVAYAMDDVLLRSLLANAPDAADYRISDQALTLEPYAIGMKRDDPVFKQLVDGVITDLYRRGAIEAIYRKWFESPIPPRGVNLKLPMSASLRRVIAHPTDASDPRLYR
ncbi:MAG: amino acid ABC transporter substrate-binding protein [Burkholderiales bacterium]|nr:amino acid ABC transporter substrate-binding protein [Burkholderiales bacterium]MDE1929098.1 amino acid ABC transporter substrate-binding protein [Burkholderiales bacterium]MDE2160176.1 amino acid ABC transporter substrate-binding protein [Burkholderiales bacterium]MDE2505059.1 amino acid ABC transporter substrate-binding protein [Burkholderiales bacterium]